MLAFSAKKRAIFTSLAIVALLTLSVILGTLVKRPHSVRNNPPLESKHTIDLNGLTYTVMGVRHANNMGTIEPRDGTFYLVVDLKVRNPKSEGVWHYEKFQLVDSKDGGYGLAGFATALADNGFYKHFDILKESSKSITLVFEVPKESLSQTWTLQIQNKNEETSPGMINVGPATKALVNG